MKKIARTIAMVLVLVMLATSYTSCISMIGSVFSGTFDVNDIWLYVICDILIIAGVVVFGVFMISENAEAPNETGIYPAKAGGNPTDYDLAIDRFYSLPDEERASLVQAFHSLYAENSFSLFETVTALPVTEIDFSAKRLNALSDEEFASAVRRFNSLSEAERECALEELNRRASTVREPENVVLADGF